MIKVKIATDYLELILFHSALKLITPAHLILWVCQTDGLRPANKSCSVVLHKLI